MLGGSSSSSLNSLLGGSFNDLLGPAQLGAPSGGAPGGSPGSMGTGAPMGDLTSSLTSLLGANSLNDLLLSPLGGVSSAAAPAGRKRRRRDVIDNDVTGDEENNVVMVLGFLCQPGAKCTALLSFGLHRRGREGDPDDWAAQVHHITCPGLRPGEVTPVPLFQRQKQHGRQQIRVISQEHIGVSSGAMGCLRRWEGSSRPTGQLSPASKLGSPQPAKGKGLHVFLSFHRTAVRRHCCILSLRLTTTSGPVNIMSVYAPTLCLAAEAKDEFYEELAAAIKKLPTSEYLNLLGDFNTRIGSDQTSWPRCIGHFGVGKLNENGQRLLVLCSFYDLCITNTFFSTKPNHRVSWRHPRSRHWHQLDLVITQRPLLNCILTTRSYHSADCDTDHSMVASMVRLQPKRIHRSKQKGRPRINTAMTSVPELRERFADTIQEALSNCPTSSVEERWNHIRGATYESAVGTFGKRDRENTDWFEAGIVDLEPAISSKRTALLNYKEDPSEKTLAALRKARIITQRTARQCANNYWQSLCQSIQLSADCGNIRAMYKGMKKAFGPSAIKIAPLKSTTGEIITDRTKQTERWAEYYQELYSRETIVTDTAVENTCSLPVMEELDDPPTIKELSKAIDSLASGEAPGIDGIPPEVIKAGKQTSLLEHLHNLLLQW
ncbi:hypothetical protein ACOMHN_061841 [Nucella lapillus]